MSGIDPFSIVYVRTGKGKVVLRMSNSNLTRKMKTLLMAVDGRTSVERFQLLLPNFGDVKVLLDRLRADGLIVALEPRRSMPRESGQPNLHSANSAPETNSPNEHAFGRYESRPKASIRFESKGSGSNSHFPSNMASEAAVTMVELARVRDTRSVMANFLFQYRPDEAVEIMLALERLESSEQMLSSLDSYGNMLGDGQEVLKHLAAVRSILVN